MIGVTVSFQFAYNGGFLLVGPFGNNPMAMSECRGTECHEGQRQLTDNVEQQSSHDSPWQSNTNLLQRIDVSYCHSATTGVMALPCYCHANCHASAFGRSLLSGSPQQSPRRIAVAWPNRGNRRQCAPLH